MSIERGIAGRLPYAAVGAGGPVAFLAGGSPTTGVAGDGFVRAVLGPLGAVKDRRLIVFNRRPDLPADLTMRDLAVEQADAIRQLGAPMDVIGVSTGGSIAQQVAADHPDAVRRLVVLSSACRLGPLGRRLQAEVAAELRERHLRRAVGVGAGAIAPRGLRSIGRGVGWVAARRAIPSERAAADLLATLDAEDAFDLATCAPVTAPTLIIGGGRDRFYSPELFAETSALIAGSQLHVFADRGHVTVMRDRRAQAMIAGFLNWRG